MNAQSVRNLLQTELKQLWELSQSTKKAFLPLWHPVSAPVAQKEYFLPVLVGIEAGPAGSELHGRIGRFTLWLFLVSTFVFEEVDVVCEVLRLYELLMIYDRITWLIKDDRTPRSLSEADSADSTVALELNRRSPPDLTVVRRSSTILDGLSYMTDNITFCETINREPRIGALGHLGPQERPPRSSWPRVINKKKYGPLKYYIWPELPAGGAKS